MDGAGFGRIPKIAFFNCETHNCEHAAKQSTWVAVSYTRDTDVVNRLAEVLGRPKPEIRAALAGLDQYAWLIVGRNPREPYRVTIPDFIAPKAEPAA